MNTDGTAFLGVTERWSTTVASVFAVVHIAMVAGGRHLWSGVGPENVPGEEGGFLFRINTDGSGFTVLHEFVKPNLYPDGSSPEFFEASDGVSTGLDSSPEG